MIPGSRCSPTCAIVAATRSPARGDPLDLLGALADDHAAVASTLLDLVEDFVDAALARAIVRSDPWRPGSARRPAPSARGRCASRRAITSGVSSARPSSWRAAERVERSPSRRRGRRRARRRAAVRSRSSISSSASACDEVAREAVEHEAPARIVLREPLADERDRQLVRDELAATRGSARPGGRAPSRSRSRRGTCRPSRRAGRRGAAEIRFACVPFPDPCGPRTRTLIVAI